MRTSEVDFPWHELYDRLIAGQQKLYSIQYDNYSDWRARKLLGLRDSETIFHELEGKRLAEELTYGFTWNLFTDELVDLYVAAHERADEPYGIGLALALEYQRGWGPAVDALPLPELVKPRGLVLKP